MTARVALLIRQHLKVDAETATTYAAAVTKVYESGTAISAPPKIHKGAKLYPSFLKHPPASIYGGLVVYNRKGDIAALDRIAAAISEISYALDQSALSDAARLELLTNLGFGEFRDPESSEDKRGEYHEAIGGKVCDALEHVKIYRDQILQGIDATKCNILDSSNSSPNPERVGLQAASVVDIAMVYWRRHISEKIPKKQLNSATPLAGFLSELFQNLGLEADVVSAYKSWAKLKFSEENI